MILTAAAIAVVCLGACSSTGQLETIQAQISEVDLRLLELAEQAATTSDVETLASALGSEAQTRREKESEARSEIAQLATQVSELGERIDDSLFRLTQLSELIAMTQQELQTLRDLSEVAFNRRPTASEPRAPGEIYQAAYASYQEANYDLAILGFRDYLKRNADTDLADNALYWIGESYFSLQRFDRAVEIFAEVLTRYPASDKGASAMLKSGFAQIERGQKDLGRSALESVLREHPSSPEAELARRELRGLETQS